jgi:hypothetical protein
MRFVGFTGGSRAPARYSRCGLLLVRVFSCRTTFGRIRLKYSRLSMVRPMNKRYEVVSSPCEPSLKLIFLEGTWESLPFEIRLWRPWRGGTLCTEAALTSQQRHEIVQRGYSIGHATLLGEPISNQPGAPIPKAGNTHPVPPIEAQRLASDSDRTILKGMRRSIQELAKAAEHSRGLIVETHYALRTELRCRPKLGWHRNCQGRALSGFGSSGHSRNPR